VTTRRQYSPQFREYAVWSVLDSGRPASEVAGSLGVSPDTLRRWVRQHRAAAREVNGEVSTTEGASPNGTARADAASFELRPAPLAGHQVSDQPRAAPVDKTPPQGDSKPRSVADVVTYVIDGPDDLFEGMKSISLRLRMMLLLLAWAASVLASTLVEVGPMVHELAVTAHVLSLVVAFGSVVVVDWHGLLWLARRRGLHESTRIAAAVSPLIWIGLVGLLASGALLSPDLSSPLTWVKLTFVLVVALNGAMTSTTAELLRELPPSRSAALLPRRVRTRIFVTATVSQIAWWAAIVIGFVNASKAG
jgi:transposase-like protein